MLQSLIMIICQKLMIKINNSVQKPKHGHGKQFSETSNLMLIKRKRKTQIIKINK
jgi:hypothetical protein